MEDSSMRSTREEWDKLIRDMSPECITDMGQKLSAPVGKNYKHLAGILGFSQDDVHRITLHDQSNPGRLLLQEWAQKDNTTARALRCNLSEIERHDVIRLLEKGLSEPVTLVVVIKSQDDGAILFDGVIQSFGQEKVIDALRSHEEVYQLVPELETPNKQNIFDCKVAEFRGREMAFTRSKSQENERNASQLVRRETIPRTVNVQLMEHPPSESMRERPEGKYDDVDLHERHPVTNHSNSPRLNLRENSRTLPPQASTMNAASLGSETFVKGHMVYPAHSLPHARDKSKTVPKGMSGTSAYHSIDHEAIIDSTPQNRRATIPNETHNGQDPMAAMPSLTKSSRSEPWSLNSMSSNTHRKVLFEQNSRMTSHPHTADNSVSDIYLQTDYGDSECGEYMTTTLEQFTPNRVEGLRGFHREATHNNIITHLFMPHMMNDGAYIIRPSRDEPSATSISVVFRGCVVNYRIHTRRQRSTLTNQTRTLYHLFENRCFKSIEDLIAYYKQHKVKDEDEMDGPILKTPL